MSFQVGDRFRAIVAAPLIGSPVTSDRRQNGYEPFGGIRFQDASGTKRKKDHDDIGPSFPKKIVRRTSEDERGSAREPTVSYNDREALLSALQDRFKKGPHVDFHGTYETSDPGSSHKARIKSVVAEIWKATGYRFTVKDHPQFSNGHKTRFWCSQDDAHRSKSSRAARKAQGDLYKPRQSSSGETLAKNRFPCRSRLLISSRDSSTIGGCPIVTVRMHHEVTHEPYVDLNLPPEVAQNVYDSYWTTKQAAGARPTTTGSDRMMNPPLPVHAVQQSDERESPEEDSSDEQETFNDIHPQSPKDNNPSPIFTQDHEPPPPSSHSTPPSLPLQLYHKRMLAHIRNLRDFCHGLEYQLQFNDPRLLEELEREGGQFLEFVGGCLEREGRLVPTDQSEHPIPHVANHPVPSHLNRVGPAEQPVMDSLQQSFEANPGINPGALAR